MCACYKLLSVGTDGNSDHTRVVRQLTHGTEQEQTHGTSRDRRGEATKEHKRANVKHHKKRVSERQRREQGAAADLVLIALALKHVPDAGRAVPRARDEQRLERMEGQARHGTLHMSQYYTYMHACKHTSCPVRTSSRFPVGMDQTKSSNVSRQPAHTISPLGSTARHEN